MILEARNLVKHFAKVQAVNGVSFGIPQGVCFGLLGPNGAGKTTTIELCEGITAPTSGEVLFKGQPLGPNFKQRAGIQFQNTAIQDFLQVREVLELFKSLYTDTLEISYLAKMCALEEFMDRDLKKLSGGQRQRVLLAVALINNPDIIFLDEPTTGLDPQARRNFWALVQEIKKQKKTLVLTTHYMEEAYVLCDEIAIMDRGQIIAQGKPDDLLKKHFEGLRIEVPMSDIPQDFATKLRAGSTSEIPGKVFVGSDELGIQTTQVNETLTTLLSRGVGLSRLKVRSQSLEDLFLELTGKDLRA